MPFRAIVVVCVLIALGVGAGSLLLLDDSRPDDSREESAVESPRTADDPTGRSEAARPASIERALADQGPAGDPVIAEPPLAGAKTADEPAEDEDPPQGPSLEGLVINDETGQPVPRARVTAYQPAAATDAHGGRRQIVAGHDGAFFFPGPFRPGEVLLSAEAEGYRSRTPFPSTWIETVSVAGVRIRVRRTPTLAGRILDPDFRGARAVIELSARDRRVCCFEAGEDGRFEVDDVIGRLDLWNATSATPIHVWAYHEEYLVGTATTTLTQIDREEVVEIRLERGAAISGRVMDLAGSPIAGVRLLGYPLNEDRWSRVRETSSGADGSFRVGGLPSGAFRLEPEASRGPLAPREQALHFEVEGQREVAGIEIVYVPGRAIGGVALTRSEERPLTDRLVTLHHVDWLYPLETLTDQDGQFRFPSVGEGNYTVALRGLTWSDPRPPEVKSDVSAGTINLRFVSDLEPRDGTLELTVRDGRSGRAILGDIVIELFWVEFGMPQSEIDTYKTDRNGRAVVGGLARAHHRIEVSSGDLGPAASEFEVTEARPVARLEVALRPPISVFGVVTDGGGRPVSGARVKAFAAIEPGELRPDMGTLAEPSGRFTIRDAPAGAAVVAAAAPGFAPVAHSLAAYGGIFANVRIILNPGATVDGVLSRTDGTPARALILVLKGPVATHFADTDGEGRFRFEHVEDGAFVVGLPDGTALGSGSIVAQGSLAMHLEVR